MHPSICSLSLIPSLAFGTHDFAGCARAGRTAHWARSNGIDTAFFDLRFVLIDHLSKSIPPFWTNNQQPTNSRRNKSRIHNLSKQATMKSIRTLALLAAAVVATAQSNLRGADDNVSVRPRMDVV